MFAPSAPEAEGLPSDTAELLRTTLATWFGAGELVGAELAVIKSRRIVVHEVVGWADRERAAPLERGTIFRIRSMTKPMVGMATLMLAEQGLVRLTDPVARYLPAFERGAAGRVTVEHLLRHTSGLEHPGFPRSIESYQSLREAADDVGRRGPTAAPGSRFCYSDAGSAVLGATLEVAAGMGLDDWLERNLAQRLGLADTSCRLPEAKRARLCSGYLRREGGFERYWDRTGAPRVPFFRACGGAYASVMDYARLLAVWMDGGRFGSERLLTARSVSRALSPTPGSEGWRGYAGYGQHWLLYSVPEPGQPSVLLAFGHEGSDGTLAMAAPAFDLMVLYFTQSRGSDTLFRLRRLVTEIVGRCPA